MRRQLLAAAAASALLSACAQPGVVFVGSGKSPVELRAMQTRMVPADSAAVMRGVVATMHDLGYRITKADAETGTISGTRATSLRLAAVVQPREPGQSIVRVNATIISARREAQVDSPEFYARNFFDPLGAALQRQVAAVAADVAAPEAARPAAELNTAKEREAASRAAFAARGAVLATGTPSR
jgi:hypothetical protein